MRAPRDTFDGLRGLGERHVLEDCLAGFAGAPLSPDRARVVAAMACEVEGLASTLVGIGRSPALVSPGDAHRVHDLARLLRLLGGPPDAGLASGLSDLSAAMGRLALGVPAAASEAGEALARDWVSALSWRTA